MAILYLGGHIEVQVRCLSGYPGGSCWILMLCEYNDAQSQIAYFRVGGCYFGWDVARVQRFGKTR